MIKCSMLVSEYAPCGELFEYLMFAGSLGLLPTRTYAHQMMDGLYAIHKKGFVHGDLRPHNILLSENFVLKIADFGFHRYHNYFNKNDAKSYQAPELLEGESCTHKSDIFSIAILIFMLYCAFPPFQEAVVTDWWWKRLSKGIKYLEKSKKYLPNNPAKSNQYKVAGIKALTSFWDSHTKRIPIDQEFQELMINMLHPFPDRRFSHQQIRNHKWYNRNVMTQNELQQFMRHKIKKIIETRNAKVKKMHQQMNIGQDACQSQQNEQTIPIISLLQRV